MANIITCSRIILSIVLLFCTTFSGSFYTIYLIAGFTDMIDGMVALITNKTSTFGACLDTVADFVLVAVCFVKLFPMLNIPSWLYIWTAIIAGVKLLNVGLGYVLFKQLITVHSLWNRLAGLLLFILPLTITFVDIKFSAPVVCVVASYAAIREFLYTVIMKWAVQDDN